MSRLTQAITSWIASRAEWPPRFPRAGTLLTPSEDIAPEDRSLWRLSDWQEYARFLEREGSRIAKDLRVAEASLSDVRRRLSRSNKVRQSLLTPPDKGRPGRKSGSEIQRIAEDAARLKSEAGNAMTDYEAVCCACAYRGRRHPTKREARAILNAISKARSHKKQTS